MNAIKRHIWFGFYIRLTVGNLTDKKQSSNFALRQKPKISILGTANHKRNEQIRCAPASNHFNKETRITRWQKLGISKKMNWKSSPLQHQHQHTLGKWKSFCQRLRFPRIQLDVVCHWVSTRRQKLRRTSIRCFFISLFLKLEKCTFLDSEWSPSNRMALKHHIRLFNFLVFCTLRCCAMIWSPMNSYLFLLNSARRQNIEENSCTLRLRLSIFMILATARKFLSFSTTTRNICGW